MKTRVLNKILPLLLIALFSAFNSSATSYSNGVLDLSSRDYDYLQQDQNRKAAFFGELISHTYTQQKTKEYVSGYSGLNLLEPSLQFPSSKIFKINFWNYTFDSKNLITQQLFPFQFFW